jgi:hypothetical protein
MLKHLVSWLTWRPRLAISNEPNRVPVAAKDQPGPWTPAPGRTGISCSGGGVRSASFCLGALQELDQRGKLADASYVTAVSGGAYIASAWAIANGEAAADAAAEAVVSGQSGNGHVPVRPVFGPRSPEERWVRLHSSHLLADARVYMSGAFRLVAGIVFGWFLLWLLLFGTSRLAGWGIWMTHPELRARLPIAEVTAQPEVVRVDVVPEAGTPRYRVVPVFTCGTARLWSSTTDDDSTTTQAALAVDSPGVVQVADGNVEILAQPTMRAVNAVPGRAAGDGACAAVAGSDTYTPPDGFAVRNGNKQPTLTVHDQPQLALASTAVASPAGSAAEDVRRLVEVSAPATIAQHSGMTGRPDLRLSQWQWLTGLLMLCGGILLYVIRIVYRPFNRTAKRALDWLAKLLAGSGALWLVVLVVLPWCVHEIPPFLAGLLHPGGGADPTAEGASGSDTIVAVLGLTGVMAAAVRMFGSQALRAGKAQIGTVTKVVVSVLVPAAMFVVLIYLLEFATANGPRGRYLGFGLRMQLASWPIAADWARFVLVLVALAVLLVLVDAHSWSLYPFYKRRLNGAYATRLGDEGVRELTYDDGPTLIKGVVGHPAFAEQAEVSHGTLAPGKHRRPAPQLVLCCAANVSDKSIAPPGRRAVSFTVSGDWIGSSELGWLPTEKYEEALGTRRLSDVTIVSMMAISGAAVSPGMGKMGRAWLRGLLAVLNVRLGVWLPHPGWVAAEQERRGQAARWWWKHTLTRPSWPWFLREVVGIYRPKARYLYVSDGGHWENLGLVELLRRGCTEIYCISAAGDGPEWFSTLGDAIALVREVLGIEFEIDLSPLRPQGEAPPSGRRLLPRPRKRAGKTPEAVAKPWAPKPYAVGTFTYPKTGVRGRILVAEANLTAEIPWDVQAWAESHSKFPDDPTSDQLFDHRQFESYHALGHYQIAEGLDSDEWKDAASWVRPAPARVTTNWLEVLVRAMTAAADGDDDGDRVPPAS